MKIDTMDRIARHVTVFLVLLLAAGLLHASPGTQAFEAGDYERAATLLAAEIADAPDAGKSLLLGRIAFRDNRFADAHDHFERALAGLPGDADAHYWYGAAAGTLAGNVSLFRAAGYAKRSRRALEKALALDPGHVDAHEALAQYHLQAPGFLGGDKQAAEDLARELAAFAPVEGQLLLARVYDETGRDDAARDALAALTREAPAEPRGWLRYGFALQADDDYAGAHDAFARAAETAAASADRESELGALYQIGRTAVFSERRIDDGIAALRRYVTMRDGAPDALPGVDWAHFRLGQLLTLRGDAEAADTAFEQALQITDDADLPAAVRRFRRGG